MFGNIGWGEMMVLLVAALVILGPERLPGAVMWVTKSLRQVRNYASGATQQLKDELGPEFDDLRKPLSEINQLRGMTPRSLITKHLLDGDDSLLTSFEKPKSAEPTAAPEFRASNTPNLSKPSSSGSNLAKPDSGERPPIDTDAT
ncbi:MULTISPECIES: Sec-independent protein translocase protein TatB [Antrihabitans]|uniref:Sec-independent protein translocase protein TatB n=2 Tax=Antrihabitans TaxID=2799491 RepID=A0A934NTC3_9NOCA|nr:Sec-independent protein translocase protein TatB [Antrihabitans stalagmiti]MBJ8340939.1 Sec-independent protein translocase subunit TatB [Antrihabitans stalagmiti]